MAQGSGSLEPAGYTEVCDEKIFILCASECSVRNICSPFQGRYLSELDSESRGAMEPMPHTLDKLHTEKSILLFALDITQKGPG
jgi:hypothetical protein